MRLLDKIMRKREVAPKSVAERTELDIAIDQLMAGCDITLDLGVVAYQQHRRFSLTACKEWISHGRHIALGLWRHRKALSAAYSRVGTAVRVVRTLTLPLVSLRKIRPMISWRPTRVHVMITLAACVVPLLFSKLPSPAVAFQRELLKIAKLDEVTPATVTAVPATPKNALAVAAPATQAPADHPIPAALRGDAVTAKNKSVVDVPIKKIESLPPLPFSMAPTKTTGQNVLAVPSKGQAAPPSQRSLPTDSGPPKQQAATSAKQQPLLALDLSTRPEEEVKPDEKQSVEKARSEVKPTSKGLGIAKKEEPEMAPEPSEPMLVPYKGLAVTKDGFVISDPDTRLPREIKVGSNLSSTEKLVSVDPKSNTAKTNLRILRVVE